MSKTILTFRCAFEHPATWRCATLLTAPIGPTTQHCPAKTCLFNSEERRYQGRQLLQLSELALVRMRSSRGYFSQEQHKMSRRRHQMQLHDALPYEM
jgi:hypothetical protein